MSLTSYATTQQMEPKWKRLTGRSLTTEQRTEAEEALQLAGVLIRRHVDMTDSPDLAAQDEKELIARHVSIEMVISALAVGYEVYNKSEYSTSVGGIAESAKLINPSATMYFTNAQKELFGVGPSSEPQWYFGDEPR
ncbi:hypothetical protein SAMN05444374_11633 [Rhodococcoides kroppenstedtii]|uniref:Phage protein Gp19/Gp15/Gp42 n=1 Tax=Rhodococcoides kroppenstedtii TaxID=293050 RepID=A0A1I0UAH9_9NOCA|nr:hypothetical protein [Rhodococcus kroppenstedtii]SFA60827.1 hypothetical protein SAMN05444374_11633 [Rhodococcus kroppenstedtii]